LITTEDPSGTITHLKKQYSPIVEVYSKLDDIYNAHISTVTACALSEVNIDIVGPLFRVDTWNGVFCANTLDNDDIETIKGLSNDVKYDIAIELIAINDRHISKGRVVSWKYTRDIIHMIQGDKRVHDLIEFVELKYIL